MDFLEGVRATGEELGMRLVPYQLRHSGANSDMLSRLRGSEEIMKRGRWRCLQSVSRYEKHARVTLEFSKLSAAIQQHCVVCEEQLAAAFLGSASPKRPPRRQ